MAAPIGECIRAAERAAQLIRQLLDFSRRSPSERRAVNLGKVVREVVALFSQTIDRRIEITSSIDEDLFHAYVDPNQVHQVLMNLCVNARDAIMESLDAAETSGAHPLTGYWIYIRAENAVVDDDYCRLFPYARKGRYVRLSIGDNGAGMDETTQRRVFEPFFTTKKMGRGTGLGLSTVYGIVRQCNGHIVLESVVDEGTRFAVHLPRAAGPDPDEDDQATARGDSRGSETLLVVEDEDELRATICTFFRGLGYHVLDAANGRHALAVLQRSDRAPDLLLTDVVMPEMSGPELVQTLRLTQPRMRVVYITGYTDSPAVARAHEEPGMEIVQKPVSPVDLAVIVRRVLDT